MHVTDYTRVIEDLFGKHLYDDAPSFTVILGILTFLLFLDFLANIDIENKKIYITDKSAYILPVLMIFTIIGMLIPPKVIERSSILSDNYKYTISEEKANTVDKYGVTQTRDNQVVITFESDPLLPKELTTHAAIFKKILFKQKHINTFIVGTIGQEGITIIDKNLITGTNLSTDRIKYEYRIDNYVILTKEELGKDYDKIVESMQNVHGENYLNPYQVKYSSETK